MSVTYHFKMYRNKLQPISHKDDRFSSDGCKSHVKYETSCRPFDISKSKFTFL
jgi:hypothetical protein